MNDFMNTQRCIATEIILHLYESGELKQLELLKIYIDRAVNDLKKGKV